MTHRYGSSRLVARLGTVSLVCLALGASGLIEACSSEQNTQGGVEETGSLGINLKAAPGVTLASVAYAITGNGFTKAGTIDVSGAPIISGTIGGIPAGNGFTITLTATSVEGGASFAGSATFDVTAGGTASVTVHLKGTGKSGKGKVTVNATLNVGPVIDEVTVTPQTVFVGSSISLTAVGTDPDAGPSPLSYYWSTTGGVIDDPIGPNATLTSSTPGTFTIDLTLSDGEGTDTVTTTVTFVEPDDGGSGDAGSGSGPSKPNVLLVIADDLGAESTSLYPASAVAAASDIILFGGLNGQFLIEEVERGARGMMPGSDMIPMFVDVWNRLASGDREGAWQAFTRALPLIRFELQPGMGVSAMKHNLLAAGVIHSARVRHPTASLDARSLAELEFLRHWTASRV